MNMCPKCNIPLGEGKALDDGSHPGNVCTGMGGRNMITGETLEKSIIIVDKFR